MNIFFVINGELITPALNGSILPGVTRDSVMALARHWNMPCTERKVTIKEILDAQKEGKSLEIFGTGTAAVISPVGTVKYGNEIVTINNNEVGHFTQKFYETLTGIQYGKIDDPLGWIEFVC